MDQAMVIALGKKAIQVTILVSGPMLGFALITGVILSVVQAVTSVQDMTLTFIPKILAVVLALALFFPWMLNLMLDFTRELILGIPQWIN
jgi:flagellar biosynthetic protein FliQ